MRLLIQRVLQASVSVSEKEIAKIQKGLIVYLGISESDDEKIAEKMAIKLVKLRLWDEIVSIGKKIEVKEGEEVKYEEKEQSKTQCKSWHSNLIENTYEILVISNFTLYGAFKGFRPDFKAAMKSEEAKKIYESFIQYLKMNYEKEKVKEGSFQDYMLVSSVNDGPVTMLFEEENVIENSKGNIKKKK